jgi:RNA polymerase sigma-70 factor, ECF subfamily
MLTDLKKDLLALIPSLRAFAFCLTQNLSDADDLVHSALIEIWSRQAANRDQNLKAAAFTVVHGLFLEADIASLPSMPCLRHEWFATSDDTFAACFRLLPRTVREAISIVEVWEFDLEQAAEICGCDVETIERRIGTACDHMAKTMSESERQSIRLTRINEVAPVNFSDACRAT